MRIKKATYVLEEYSIKLFSGKIIEYIRIRIKGKLSEPISDLGKMIFEEVNPWDSVPPEYREILRKYVPLVYERCVEKKAERVWKGWRKYRLKMKVNGGEVKEYDYMYFRDNEFYVAKSFLKSKIKEISLVEVKLCKGYVTYNERGTPVFIAEKEGEWVKCSKA